MEQFEYSYLTVGTGGMAALVTRLNDLSVDGWELVTSHSVDRTVGLNAVSVLIRRPIEPLPAPASVEEGWYPDPAKRFDKRFWDGQAWTFHVARSADKSQHRDPPTCRTPAANLEQ